jgi:fluoride exporter
MNWLLVFIGGGLGSVSRYGIGLIINRLGYIFPAATLVANVIACFIIGVILSFLTKETLSDQHRLLWATGFCGGLSTFSTFSAETLYLFQNDNTFLAFLNIGLSIFLCFIATYIGLKIFI